MHRLIRDYYEQLNVNKLGNQEEKDKFLETYNLPRLNHEEIKTLNKAITSKETEPVVTTSEQRKARLLHWKILPNI